MIHLLKNIYKPALAVAIGLFPGLVSCSVKEDRDDCPNYLEVRFNDREHVKDPVGLVGWSSGQQMFDVIINSADYPDVYYQPVKKCLLEFGAVEGIKTNSRNGKKVIIPLGQQCDSVYAYREQIDCTGEASETYVSFKKQFATVFLNIGKSAVDMKDYSFQVTGNSCGFDVTTFEPVEGAFLCNPDELNGNVIQFRIPRQKDDGLAVTVDYNGASNSFPLGGFINRIGYNWNSEELQDIYISIDIANGKISIGVARWEEEEEFELTYVEII